MYRARRLFIRVLTLFVVIASSIPAWAASEDASEIPASVTALDQATLAAASQAVPQAPPWNPVVDSDTSPPTDLSITAVGAWAFRLRNPSLFDAESFEVMRGPQGTLFGSNRVALGNDAVPSFYETNQTATVVTVEVTGWPEDALEEIYELAVAFNWAGEETLEESPYPGDPLVGYANVSSFGWFDGSPFKNYAKFQSELWAPYADPLFRSETTVDEGRVVVSWLLPGLPELIAANLSYSPDSTIEGMIAQHVDVPVPGEILEYPLVADFATIDTELQLTYGETFAPVAEESTATAEPGATAGDEGVTTEETGETGDVVESEPEPVAEEPVTEPTANTDGDDTTSAAGEQDEGRGLSMPFIVILPVVGAALAALIYKWLFASGKKDDAEDDATLTPVQEYEIRNSPLAQMQEWNVTLLERYQREGGTVTDDGWIAPTFGQMTRPGETPEGDPDEWTGYFLNTETFARVDMDDPRYGDLLDRLGMTPPIEYSAPVAESVPEQVVVGSDPGVDPPAAGDGSDEVPAQAAIRSHAGPSQFLTAREEAIGLAEAMVGIVVDGWHRLPWEAGSDFYVGSDGATYKTIPVANVEVSTDVILQDKPDGFEPDESRFAYWLHEDGTLKVGSPDDPHAYMVAQPSSPAEPLEAKLPMPGAGQTLNDVANARIVRAHELTGGHPPVDGWIAPSNEAYGAAWLSDASSAPGLHPTAWSGHFFHTETGEWVNARDPRHRDLIERLGVTPEPRPVETTEPINMDGDVAPD